MKVVRKIKTVFDGIINHYIIRKNSIKCEDQVVINGRINYRGAKGRLYIGENTTINSGEYNIPIGYPVRCSFWIMNQGNITIGKSCGLSNVSICSMKNVMLGDHVMLGAGVKIYDTDFHSLDYLKRREIDTDNDRRSKEIFIGNDAFIGAGTIILKGVTIGERAIIGAGSVIRNDIPANEIWAGNPAVFIKNINLSLLTF